MRLFSFVSVYHLNQQDYQREFLLGPFCVYKLNNLQAERPLKLMLS